MERCWTDAECNSSTKACRKFPAIAKGNVSRAIALRRCPDLPPTIVERIKDYRAQNFADWVMYRKALEAAAEARGWIVHWFDAKKVLAAASEALHVEDFNMYSQQLRRSIGSPWSKDHKLAMAAAIVAAKPL